jgi:acetyl esterase/lipase
MPATTGTRDLLLSNTVRAHRALRAAGVEASAAVMKGLSGPNFAQEALTVGDSPHLGGIKIR